MRGVGGEDRVYERVRGERGEKDGECMCERERQRGVKLKVNIWE